MSNTVKWRITGYIGFSDYDGIQDNNLDIQMEMDGTVTKHELEALLFERYKKYRNVVLHCQKQ